MGKNQRIAEMVRKLINRNSFTKAVKILVSLHVADTAVVLTHLKERQRQRIFLKFMESDAERAAMVLAALEREDAVLILDDLPVDAVAELLEGLESDDVVALLEQFPEEKREKIIKAMGRQEGEDALDLLQYGEETAGRIMNPDFFSLSEDLTVHQAIKALQKSEDLEMVFYVYVVDNKKHLRGVMSLRQLLMFPPETPLKELMDPDVFFVYTYTDQEEVAKIVARYDLLAVPVVDEQNHLEGIVTVDDVIDIMREEATEDLMKMAGASDEDILEASSWKSYRSRLPWLFATFAGGLFNVFMINYFQQALASVAALAGFIPVIMGMGGNVGQQSAMLVVRGLATGKVLLGHAAKMIWKQIRVALLLGLTYGLFLGIFAYYQYIDVKSLWIVVGLAIMTNILWAAVMGSLLPLVFARLNVDPAIAAGPFVATVVDMSGILIYFALAFLLILRVL